MNVTKFVGTNIFEEKIKMKKKQKLLLGSGAIMRRAKIWRRLCREETKRMNELLKRILDENIRWNIRNEGNSGVGSGVECKYRR